MNIHIPNCRWRRIHPESEIINVCLVILGPQKTVIGRPHRWDPQSKQKASNRKCRQKGNGRKSTGEMIHKEREKSFVFGILLRLFLLPGTPSPQRITSSIWFGDFAATLDYQRVSRIVASIFHQSPSIGSMVLVYILT